MKHHFRIKVCGITRISDALYAEKLGVDFIGMIFYRKSPRFLNQSKAKEICKVLKPTTRVVGVFVDHDRERIIKIATKLKMRFIQLHGSYKSSDVAYCQRHGFKVIEVFHLKTKSDYRRAMKSKAEIVMIDNTGKELPGGTGRLFDWALLPQGKIPNLMLAGGIAVDNVANGVRKYHPLIVDVNSCVESSPGVKSERLMSKFVKKCNELRYE